MLLRCSVRVPWGHGLPAAISWPQVGRRGYQHYVTSGEMAKLKEPSPSTLFCDEPKWPEVLDMSPEAVKLRERQAWYAQIRSLPTSHHKLFLLNNERGREEVFNTDKLGYNSLEGYQYATRTLHSATDNHIGTLPQVSSDVLALVEEVIAVQHSSLSSRENILKTITRASDETPVDRKYTAPCYPLSCEEPGEPTDHRRSRGQHILLAVLNALRYSSALSDSVVIERPRIEAFWQHPRFRTDRTFKHRYEDADTFAPMLQHSAYADALVSTSIPLRPVVSPDSPDCLLSGGGGSIPEHDFYPVTQGWLRLKRNVVSTPGFWPESGQFPLVCADDWTKVFPTRNNDLTEVIPELVSSQAERERRLAAHSLINNFAMAAATAYNQGFTLYHELTYPIVSQHIVSDGQHWFIQRLQLNTLAFGPDFAQQNEKQNLAWSSGELKLYDTVEDGKVKGLNTDVLSRIVLTLMAERQLLAGDAAPYLDLGVETDFLERGRRLWKHMASRRFNLGAYLDREVPLWVKIYKMHEDAPPTPMLKWERKKHQHMYQVDWDILKADWKRAEDARKQKNRERLFQGQHLKDD